MGVTYNIREGLTVSFNLFGRAYTKLTTWASPSAIDKWHIKNTFAIWTFMLLFIRGLA